MSGGGKFWVESGTARLNIWKGELRWVLIDRKALVLREGHG
jgi:hypothetical protein